MKKFLALILALIMGLSLVACGGDKAAEAPADTKTEAPAESGDAAVEFEEMTWKFACSATENTCWADMGRDFGQMVSDATGGAITVEVYAADQLTAGNQTEGIQGAIDGTIELSAHSNIIYANFDQRLNVVSMPFLFDSYEDVDAKLTGAPGEAVGKVVEDLGLHLLGVGENGFRAITNSKKPIESLADMNGLKIRVAGCKVLNTAYGLWGANWSNANWSEVYTGLQTGTYEGQENPLPTADGASIQEVNKYCANWTGIYDCIFFTMNKELYDSLSPELQAIVDECGAKAAENQRELQRQGVQEVMDKWTAAGVTITELSDEAVAEFKAATEPMYSDPEIVELLTQDLIDAFTA